MCKKIKGDKMRRYTNKIEFYTYANSDAEAKDVSEGMAKLIRGLDDNEAKVVSLHETPFGSLESRDVYELVSNCCGATIIANSDVCTQCKEHCVGVGYEN